MHGLNSRKGVCRSVLELTGVVGVDVSIEAVGYPGTLLTAAPLVRPGGTIASIGVHGVPVALPMQDMWIQDVTVTMGLVVGGVYPTLLKMVASRRNPGGEDGHSFVHLRPDGRGVRRVQERRRELRPQGDDHSRLVPACHKSFVSFGCWNDQN